MDLGIADRVFYTRTNGLRPPTMVVATAEDGLLHLEYYQDGLRVVNRQCKMESISAAQHTVKFLPKGPWSLPQEPGRSPSRSPPVQFGSPNSKDVSMGRA